MRSRFAAVPALFYGVCACAATLIAPGTFVVEGEATPNRQPDCNSILIEAPQGLIVFDTGRHQEHTQLLLDFARIQGRPIAAIINSHWHLDHIGGNPQLRDYYLLLAVRGHFLEELGRREEAAASWRAALECRCSEPERRFLRRKLANAAQP